MMAIDARIEDPDVHRPRPGLKLMRLRCADLDHVPLQRLHRVGRTARRRHPAMAAASTTVSSPLASASSIDENAFQLKSCETCSTRFEARIAAAIFGRGADHEDADLVGEVGVDRRAGAVTT